jgi:lysophospholipase L1-like esterase
VADALPSVDASPIQAPPLRRSRAPGLWLALASTLLTLAGLEAGLEAGLWLFHPLPDPYEAAKITTGPRVKDGAYVPSSFAPHFVFHVRAEPGLPGIDQRPRTFSMNNLGYRGDSLAITKPPGEVRVFMVGGSTTECLYLDDPEAVTAVLQRRLRALLPGVNVRVYGAGHSGDRSFDHVAMVAHRIAHLQPDVIVVFAGINDVLAGLRGRDYLMMGNPDPRLHLTTGQLLRILSTQFQVPRLVHRAFTGYDPEIVTVVSDYRKNARRLSRVPQTARPPRTDVRPYAENLQTLAGIAKAHGVRMVFMTQQTTWNSPDPRAREWHWMTGDTVRYREPSLDAAMRLYNRAMLDVAREQGMPVLDLARALPKSMDYFYDDVHFNVRGADTTAALLARFIVDQGVIARSAAAPAAGR